jgi:hypothetical protein
MGVVLEKIGFAGSPPGLGPAVADVAVGAMVGISSFAVLGTLTPHLAAALGGRLRATAAALVLISLAMAAWFSAGVGGQPFSRAHPHRVAVQHIHRHTDVEVVESKWNFGSLDPLPPLPTQV